REAYRTFVVQLAVRPDFKLEMRERTVDLGLLWHGFESPPPGQVFGPPSAAVPAATQQFYQNYWKPFTLVNTGNVNLPFIKPEVTLSLRPDANSKPVFSGMVPLNSDSVDSLRALTLVRNPNDPGADLSKPANIYLETSFDDLLLPGSALYGQGKGAWLQKARAGSSAPGTSVFANDPSVPNAASRQTYLTLRVPE